MHHKSCNQCTLFIRISSFSLNLSILVDCRSKIILKLFLNMLFFENSYNNHIFTYKCKPHYVAECSVAYKWLLLVYKVKKSKEKMKIIIRKRKTSTNSFSTKDLVSGPDVDSGHLSLNVDQLSVFYRKFLKHSNKVSRM